MSNTRAIRSIRFSDGEWNDILKEAVRLNPPLDRSTFVRWAVKEKVKELRIRKINAQLRKSL